VNLPFVRDVMFTDGVDFFTTTGAIDPPYAVENFRLESTNFESRIPTMVWRSVGNSHTEFARESAIDELAIAAGRDPVDLRRQLLAGSPRTLRALEPPVPGTPPAPTWTPRWPMQRSGHSQAPARPTSTSAGHGSMATTPRSAAKARGELGWSPTHPDLVDELRQCSYSKQPTG
jgi:CO/xanthine dehydrogenase Mo-binding subunit